MDNKVEKYFQLLHPEYDTLTPEQQRELEDDRNFIADNIDKIDREYEGYIQEGSCAQRAGMSEQEMIAEIVKIAKIGRYMDILNIDGEEKLSAGQRMALVGETMDLIVYNFDRMDGYCRYYMQEGNGDGLTEKDIVSNALRIIRMVRTDEYFRLLHPEYDTLTPEEQMRLMDDKLFIADNISRIEWENSNRGRGNELTEEEEGLTEQKFIQEIIEKVKKELEQEKQRQQLEDEQDMTVSEDKLEQIYDKGKSGIRKIVEGIKKFLGLGLEDNTQGKAPEEK